MKNVILHSVWLLAACQESMPIKLQYIHQHQPTDTEHDALNVLQIMPLIMSSQFTDPCFNHVFSEMLWVRLCSVEMWRWGILDSYSQFLKNFFKYFFWWKILRRLVEIFLLVKNIEKACWIFLSLACVDEDSWCLWHDAGTWMTSRQCNYHSNPRPHPQQLQLMLTHDRNHKQQTGWTRVISNIGWRTNRPLF